MTLQALDVSAMVLDGTKCTFFINSLLKTSRSGKHLGSIELLSYEPDMRLCPVAHIHEYVKRTAKLRGEQRKQFISYQMTHKEVSGKTVSRWFKNTLKLAGINTSKFGAHSTRAATTSAAKAASMPIDIIMQSVGWSQESTFGKHYNKPVDTAANFGDFLLNSTK